MHILLALLFMQVLNSNGQMTLRLMSGISDHAVLQQKAEVKVWIGSGVVKGCCCLQHE